MVRYSGVGFSWRVGLPGACSGVFCFGLLRVGLGGVSGGGRGYIKRCVLELIRGS